MHHWVWSKFLGVIRKHAAQKKKVVLATDRSRLENRYYKSKTEGSLRAYKKQNNFVVSSAKRKERNITQI